MTATITAADVNKLRTITGAGMMDCKKALTEANGDFEAAIDFLRKKGQKVAANRADRDAKEGVVLAKVSADGKHGALVCINCETDFVAKNEDFVKFVQSVLDLGLDKKAKSIEEVKASPLNGLSVEERINEQVGKIGEKIELSKFEVVEAAKVVAYIHPGNRLSTLIGFNKATSDDLAKDIAMQAAAMAPVAIDKNDVDTETLQREMEIAREQVRQEGKPENMVEKIAEGKLNKFFKESTLLNQEFIKDGKKTVRQYLQDADKELTVTGLKRVALA
jgi:elongation factor Ts